MAVRPALVTDLPVIRQILETHASSEASLRRDPSFTDELEDVMFGPDAFVRVTMADRPGKSGPVLAGLALWFRTFSSWGRRSGIWLEDLYVLEAHRHSGVGRELMMYLRSQTAGRVDWDVTIGNAGAERFYESLGARPLRKETRYRWIIDDPLRPIVAADDR
jgi:GNAT superfamily N-acetyltransferase